MCGIGGYYGNFDNDLLLKMSNILVTRGPDDYGTYSDKEKGVGLVHRRLSIIDLSNSGKQPMWDYTNRVCITFNGEIYNYKELRKELECGGYKFRSNTDTEVLLNLFLKDGPKMLNSLNGMFAFAIWDKRNNSLFLARDGIGIKPLYFSETNKGFIFASELKAILLDLSVNLDIDHQAIQYYLTYLWCPSPQTMLKSVKKLEPGHALIVENSKITKKWQFYDLPYNQGIIEIPVRDAIEQVHDSVKKAVERQMVSDVPVGAFLSGGLDSSSVVAFAQMENFKQKLQCFTIELTGCGAYSEGISNDLPYAIRTAKHLGVDLHTIKVDSSMINHLEKMIYYLDEPQADPAPLNALFISKLARENGIKVLLSGAGGDDIFTGYRRHFALQQEKYWAWLPRPFRKLIVVVANVLPVNHPFLRRLVKAFQYADCDEVTRLVNYFFWIRPNMLDKLFLNNIKSDFKTEGPKFPLISTLKSLRSDIPNVNKMLYLEGKHFLPDHNLNYTDKMSMAEGVEVRVPLLDLDLVSLAASLPTKYKQHGSTGKWIFKKAMEPYLPKDIIYRPKAGFGAPLRRWLKNELRGDVEKILSEESIRHRGIFSYTAVKSLLELDQAGKIDASYTIFSLMCIELWCRIFLDKKAISI